MKPAGQDCYLPSHRLITVSITSPLIIMDSLEHLTNNLIEACNMSLNLFNTTSIYSRLLSGILNDLNSHLKHLHSLSLFLCELDHKPINRTMNSIDRPTPNVKNPPNHNIIDRLTQSWESHAAIGLGVQTFGSITSTRSISRHLGKAIVNLANEVKTSQDIIAHFLVFESAAKGLQTHISHILSYLQAISIGKSGTNLSKLFSDKIKFHLMPMIDLNVNPFRTARMLNRILNRSQFSTNYHKANSTLCKSHTSELTCKCVSLEVIFFIKTPKTIVNCLVLDPLSGRLFNPLHENSETYLFTSFDSITLTQDLNTKPSTSFITENRSYKKAIFLTQPIYCMPLQMRAFILPDLGLYLVDPLQGRTINYNCTFTNQLGVLGYNNTIINAENQGTIYYFPNCQIKSNGILNIFSESLLLSNNIISDNLASSTNINDIFLNIENLSQESLYRNSSVTMNDDTIRSIENELTLSQDSEQTLNRRLSKLEDGNYIRNLIKHYSDIFFATLILSFLIALSLYVTNCVCKAKSLSKDSSDNLKIKTHIERLEKYVLGVERSDFKDDLIITHSNHKTESKISPSTKSTPLFDSPSSTGITTQDNHIVAD